MLSVHDGAIQPIAAPASRAKSCTGSPCKTPPAGPQAQCRSHPAHKRTDTAGRLGQRRRKGLSYRDNTTLLPGLSQRYGANGRVRPWPPWLTHPGRRRPVASVPAAPAEAAAAGTQAADPVDGPPLRCRQRYQHRVRDYDSLQAAPPPTRAASMRQPAITQASTGSAGDQPPAPGRSPKNPALPAEPGQHAGRAHPHRRPAEPAQVIPSERLAHEHDDRRQRDRRQRDGAEDQHPRRDDASVPDPVRPHGPILRAIRIMRLPRGHAVSELRVISEALPFTRVLTAWE
jgi:hypothetical protein